MSMIRCGRRLKSLGGALGWRAISTSSVMRLEKCISEIRLLGRVGRDPVAYPHVTGDGQIVFFSVATSFPAKTRAEDGTIVPAEPRVTWHDIAVHRPGLQEYVLQYIRKGLRVLCTGHLESRQVDRNGEYQKKINITLNELVIVGYPQSRQPDEFEEGEHSNNDQ